MTIETIIRDGHKISLATWRNKTVYGETNFQAFSNMLGVILMWRLEEWPKSVGISSK